MWNSPPELRVAMLLVHAALANVAFSADPVPTYTCPSSSVSDGECVAVLVSRELSNCTSAANETCEAAAAVPVSSGECGADQVSSTDGFMWGILVSIVCDIVISVGLALQKSAHNRLQRTQQAHDVTSAEEPTLSDPTLPAESATSIEAPATAANEPKQAAGKNAYMKLPQWWAGILLTVAGEVGNFAAYGDPSTPASVVTAVGCVGVISSSAIAAIFLKEPFRRRDALGCFFVVIGVFLVVIFAPQQPCALTADRFYWLLTQPQAIAVLCVLVVSIIVLGFLIPKYGHKHVLWNLGQASLLGSLTVMASKAVSTFVVLTVSALFDPNIPFWDQVDLSYTTNSSCTDAGHYWGPLNATEPYTYGCITYKPWYEAARDEDGNIIIKGSQQLTEWGLYVCLVVLVVTAIAQVKYINQGMALFDNTEVVPAHYVTFTLFSICASSIFYQEFAVDRPIDLHLFIDGCILTFFGVYLITSNKRSAEQIADKLMDDRVISIHHHHKPPPPPGSPEGLRKDCGEPTEPADSSSEPPLRVEVGDAADVSVIGVLPRRRGYSEGHPMGSRNNSLMRRQPVTERWGLPTPSLDARENREHRSSSFITFMGVLGGGQATSFLYDPQVHNQEADELRKGSYPTLRNTSNRQTRNSSNRHHSFPTASSAADNAEAGFGKPRKRLRSPQLGDGESRAITAHI